MQLDGTHAGLWLVGVGAFLAALPRLIGAAKPELGVPWESLSARAERLRYAVETVGLILVGAGSALLAFVARGPMWFVLGVAGVAALAVWTVAAAKLRQLWMMRLLTSREYADQDGVIVSALEQRTTALAQASWRNRLRRAFSPTPPWPPPRSQASPARVAPGRLEPGHIANLDSADERLADLHIPPTVAHDVKLIRAQGFRVDVADDAIIATALDGRTAQVSRSAVAVNSPGGVIHRQRWINELIDLGLTVRPERGGRLESASRTIEG
jgi:hypothetical protein